MKLSKIDYRILKEVQQDGRITYSELAKRVGLTVTPCMERVKKLEKAGVVKGYSANLNPEMLGAGLAVFVQIRLSRTSQDIFTDFNKAVKELDNVQECYLVSGDFDYLIKARVKDMSAYREFLGETLLSLPGVHESTTHVVMEEIKETTTVNIMES